jgi:selT/selW/selH-like putative selenoprotein
MQLKQFLETQYPQLIGNINGENFPPSDKNLMIANVVGKVQMAGMFFVMFGSMIDNMIGKPLPRAMMDYISENRFQMFVCFFLLNGFAGSLLSTGAFEVQFNEQVIFSKIETGRMPNLQELIASFEAAGLKQIGA